jgi:hypothetical protein
MSLPNIQENNQQILNDIQSLQNIEQSLFTNLETNPNLTTEQQQEIINKISDISDMRINLYHTLGDVNNYFQSALSNSQGTLNEQATAIGIVETELNKSKVELSLLEQEKNNKIRMIEINNFYGNKYADHTILMKYIMFMIIPIIIFSVLLNKNIISKNIFYILLFIISSIGAYFIITQLVSIWNRDNMNYQEYNWYFDASSAPEAVSSSDDPWTTTTSANTCTSTTSTTTTTTTESFLPSNSFKY